MASELLKSVYRIRNLEAAWRAIQENGRTSKSETIKAELEEFADNASHNLRSIQARLKRRSFKFGQARGIVIPKADLSGKRTGKFRPIVLASVEARVVQRAILNVLIDLPSLQPFVRNPHSFGGIRKTISASSQQSLQNSRDECLSAVPAAIKALLDEIGKGSDFFVSADIQSFFTRIPKNEVTAIIREAVKVDDFVELFSKAIHVELENMSSLRERAKLFPIEEIGVAQGNSLSPLLGNIILARFDAEMNEGDCRCIRYIDDFIILAPSARAANARLRNATRLLGNLGMRLSPEKTLNGARNIAEGIEFLGISIAPGLIRPTTKAQTRFIQSIKNTLEESRKSFIGLKHGQPMRQSQSLISTLKRVDGIINGWGKHYWFCNDGQLLRNLDQKVSSLIRDFLGIYKNTRSVLPSSNKNQLLGISELAALDREPFLYPKSRRIDPLPQDASVLG